MKPQFELDIRVRYNETDAQGHVHHANYFNYFELGRTEMMRTADRAYEQLEAEGVHLVISAISCRYFRPCRFGDCVRLRVTTVRAKGARLKHEYQLFLDGELLAEGESTIGCVDDQGKVRRLPDWMLAGVTES